MTGIIKVASAQCQLYYLKNNKKHVSVKLPHHRTFVYSRMYILGEYLYIIPLNESFLKGIKIPNSNIPILSGWCFILLPWCFLWFLFPHNYITQRLQEMMAFLPAFLHVSAKEQKGKSKHRWSVEFNRAISQIDLGD